MADGASLNEPSGVRTARDVCAALTQRWPDDRYLHVYEAPLDSGRQGSKIDVLVLSLWASDGLALDAVEVKVSYSDWCKEWRRTVWWFDDHNGIRREFTRTPTTYDLGRYTHGSDWWENQRRWRRDDVLQDEPPEGFEPKVHRRHVVDTSKNAAWRTKATRFWVAAPAKVAAKIAADVASHVELAGWGVIAVDDDSTTHYLVRAARNVSREPLTHPQYLGIIRCAADSGFGALQRARSLGYRDGHRDGRRDQRQQSDRAAHHEWYRLLNHTGGRR